MCSKSLWGSRISRLFFSNNADTYMYVSTCTFIHIQIHSAGISEVSRSKERRKNSITMGLVMKSVEPVA